MSRAIMVLVTEPPQPRPMTESGDFSTVFVEGKNIVVRTDTFKKGDLALFIPPDCDIPKNVMEEFNDYNFDTEGMLIPLTHPIFSKILGFRYVGEDLTDALNIKI